MNLLPKDVKQQKDYGLTTVETTMQVLLGQIYSVDGRKLFIGWMSNWDYAQKKYQQKHGEAV
jgi:levanase/fructan beta-fructosidase